MVSSSYLDYALLLFASCIAVQFIVMFIRPFKRRRPPQKRARSFMPLVSVIMPCKGAEPGFEEFIRSLEQQDYKNAEFIFCFGTPDDPGVQVVRDTVRSLTHQIVIAEHLETTSGMNENMIAGLQKSSPAAEVLAFIDVDGVIPSHYLRSLITPLSDDHYLCSSTFRQFEAKNLGGMIAKYWNYLSLYFREMPEGAFPWGGGMAVRRGDLKTLNLPDMWYGILDDDMPLMRHIRSIGGEIFLVDEYCTSHVEYSIIDALKWIRRTTVYPALYYPELRRLHALQELFVLSYIALYLVTDNALYLLPLAGFTALVTLLTFRHGNWKERALAPWLTLMLIVSSLWTSTTLPFLRRIEWADTEYLFDKSGKVSSRRSLVANEPQGVAIADMTGNPTVKKLYRSQA